LISDVDKMNKAVLQQTGNGNKMDGNNYYNASIDPFYLRSSYRQHISFYFVEILIQDISAHFEYICDNSKLYLRVQMIALQDRMECIFHEITSGMYRKRRHHLDICKRNNYIHQNRHQLDVLRTSISLVFAKMRKKIGLQKWVVHISWY